MLFCTFMSLCGWTLSVSRSIETMKYSIIWLNSVVFQDQLKQCCKNFDFKRYLDGFSGTVLAFDLNSFTIKDNDP